MSEKVKLRECPFCGGNPQIARRDVEPQGDPWYGSKMERIVECSDCGCTLFNQQFHEGFYTEADAIAAWNRRAPAKEGM